MQNFAVVQMLNPGTTKNFRSVLTRCLYDMYLIIYIATAEKIDIVWVYTSTVLRIV